MTPKCHGVIRGRRDLLFDPKVTVTFVVSLTKFMIPKGHRIIRGRRDLLYDPKGHGDLCGRFDLFYDPKEVAKIHFMTPKVTVTFVVGLT